jgi:tetratricopeptide (TPR) repeat protein
LLRKLLYTAFVAIFLMAWVGCTTQKNTWLTRKFHTTCAHYNGYFWGNLSYEEGLKKLVTTHKDDYSDILPVYTYAESQEAQAIYPEMDRAIKKASTMIENHTITDKNKREVPDAVKYIKYCYMLMAKARLYKNEYLSAIDALEYTSRMYKKTDVKYEAMIWEARAYNQIGSVSKSEELIDYLKSNKDVPKKLLPQVYAVTADYYSRTGQWDEVAKWLEKAASTERDKKLRARYYFILAQLAQKNGNQQKAFLYYSNVLKMHPYYDLEFAATINRALLYMGNGKENQNIKKQLVKMLKPTKNIDNRDQIYYALAQISLKEGDSAQGVKYLNKSIRVSTTNPRQKSVSFLSLADLNFDWEEYVLSKKYYDSTLISLPKNFKGRDSIVAKKENLQKLVHCLEIIAFQDSVQKLAKMDKKELNHYLDNMIDEMKQAEEDKKRQEAEAQQTPANNNTNNTTVANGKWYFYNPGAMMQGLNEFTQKWGNRPLEDNWNRKNKIADANQLGNENGNKTADTTTSKGKTVKLNPKDSTNNKYSRAYYLKNLPLTDEKMRASNDSLIEAFNNAGYIYKEYLHNYKKSWTDFEELLKRYPDNKYKLPVYYQLYRIYKQVGNTERMEYYKNILLTQYPNTEYARLISNPEKYRQDLEADKQQMINLYTLTLQAYNKQDFALVMNNCKQADSLYSKSEYMPKFAYLEAVATGYSQGLEAYKNALTRVMVLYPKDSVKILAQTTLNYLNKKKDIPAVKDTSVHYSTDKDTVYYWIMLIDNKESGKINDMRLAITDMNSKTFSQDNLQMDNISLNSNAQMIVLRKFSTLDNVKNYHLFVSADSDLFKSLSPNSYQTFYISGQNFRILLNHKKADEYLSFFKDKL